MSLWYDKQGKNYASDGKTSWIKVYAEHIVETLKNSMIAKFGMHYEGLEGRHKAEDVDYDSASTIKEKIEEEENARINGDNDILVAVRDEENARISGDNDIIGAVRDEENARINGDNDILGDVRDEENARISADQILQTQINEEKTARENSDNTLEDLITTETENRIQDKSALEESIRAEVTAREKQISLLRTDLESEEEARIASHNALNTSITTEVTNRSNEIESLRNNVLTKDNTTQFIPTKDYHPATKKYIDNFASGVGDMMKNVYDKNNKGIVDNSQKLGGKLPEYYVAKEQISHILTHPDITPVSDRKIIGHSGWYGTGYIYLETNEKYSLPDFDGSSPFYDIRMSDRFCIKLGNEECDYREWTNWTPYLDIDGMEFEFFYSPTRKLYETLIPGFGVDSSDMIDYIEWKRAKPCEIRYGKLGSMIQITTNEDGTEVYSFNSDAASIRDSAGPYTEQDAKFIDAYVRNKITIPSGLDYNLLSLIYLKMDVDGNGQINSDDYQKLVNRVKGQGLLPVEVMDRQGLGA